MRISYWSSDVCYSDLWRHLNMAHTAAAETRVEIEEGARRIEDASGREIQMFRPPRGRLNEHALRVLAPLRQDIVIWSVTRGALDWRSPQKVADNVVEQTGPGDIIDFHDGLGRRSEEHTSELQSLMPISYA